MNAAIKAYKAQTAKACKAQKAQATIVTKLAHSHETQIALLSSQNTQIEPLNSHKQQTKPLNSHSSQGEQEAKPLNSRETLNLHNAQIKLANSHDLQKPNSHEFTGFSNPQIEPNILPYALQIKQNSNQAQTIQTKPQAKGKTYYITTILTQRYFSLQILMSLILTYFTRFFIS